MITKIFMEGDCNYLMCSHEQTQSRKVGRNIRVSLPALFDILAMYPCQPMMLIK